MTKREIFEDQAELIGHSDEPSFVAALLRAEAMARANADYYLQEIKRLDAELRRRGARR